MVQQAIYKWESSKPVVESATLVMKVESQSNRHHTILILSQQKQGYSKHLGPNKFWDTLNEINTRAKSERGSYKCLVNNSLQEINAWTSIQINAVYISSISNAWQLIALLCCGFTSISTLLQSQFTIYPLSASKIANTIGLYSCKVLKHLLIT